MPFKTPNPSNKKMKKGFQLIVLIIAFYSCTPSPITERAKKEVMSKAHFDKKGIQNIAKYENLKSFLEKNMDTIIRFRYHKNIGTYVRGEGKPDSTYLSDDDCYIFFQGNDDYDITNVPDHLKKELDSLYHSFNEKETPSFEVCKDRKISIEIKRERFENGLALLHTLIWNARSNNDIEYTKDTVLSNKCMYRIRLTKLGR